MTPDYDAAIRGHVVKMLYLESEKFARALSGNKLLRLSLPSRRTWHADN